MTYDMIWHDMIWYIWYDIWYDRTWYDMIYDMIWYDMTYDMIYDMTWHDMMIWYDMIWYDMIWYDMIWYDMLWCMIWYDIFVNCNWVATRWKLYNSHLHTNNTQNDTKQTIHWTTQKFWKSTGCPYQRRLSSSLRLQEINALNSVHKISTLSQILSSYRNLF